MFRHVFMLYVLGVSVFVVTVFAAGQSHVITQKDKAFSVAELTAKSGDTIVFKNDDDVAHNVFSQTPGFEFNAKTQVPGTETPVNFDKSGTVEIPCAIHPKMKAVIHVQ
jgi:plastocyanin